MRILITVLLLLAVPAFAAAQEQGDAADFTPQVEVQQSVDDASTADVEVEAMDVERDVDADEAPADEPAVVQDPTPRGWWWLVGAVVVGGLIVALVL